MDGTFPTNRKVLSKVAISINHWSEIGLYLLIVQGGMWGRVAESYRSENNSMEPSIILEKGRCMIFPAR
nr:hypothetical protein [Variovorax sp. IB41]